jgi:hypothetical protein
MSFLPLAASLTAGAIWGTLAAAILFVCFVAAVVGAFALPEGADGRRSFMAVGTAGALATVVVWLWAMWPLKYDYHHWVEKSGRVEKISNRLVSGGEGVVNQRFVVVLHGQPYGIDDTRAALLHVGDPVHLRCKKEHQFFQPYAADGWACRWGV